MSLANIQPPAGLTFEPSTITAAAATTIAVKAVVKVDLSDLTGTTPAVNVAIAASAGAGIYGVVTNAISAAKDGTVQLGGIATVIASEAIAEGALVSAVATTGKVETADATEFVVGVACTAAAADADELEVLLTANPTITAV